jgi:hypothetical protein
MDSFMWGVLKYIGQYLLLILMGFFVANFTSKGMLWTIAKARMNARSGGVIVRVNSPLRSYFRIGKVNGDILTYKNRAGNTCVITITDAECFRDFLGLKMIETDEVTNNVLKADFSVVPGHDAEKVNNLYVRILTLPKKLNNRDTLTLIFVVACLVVSLYTAYKLGKVQEAVNAARVVSGVVETGVMP